MPAQISDQDRPAHAVVALPRKTRIILAYENLSAALWAAEAFAGLIRKTPGGAEIQLLPLSFSSLSTPATQAQAMADAAQADMIVIATSNRFHLLPASVDTWLTKCLSRRLSPKTAVAALFSRAQVPDGADSQRLLTVKHLAEEARCLFFIPFATDASQAGAAG